MKPNSRIHLTHWAVTALAETHRRQDHHPGLPGPRRPQPAGDANVRHHFALNLGVIPIALFVAAWLSASIVTAEPVDECGRFFTSTGCVEFYPVRGQAMYITDLDSLPPGGTEIPFRLRGDLVQLERICDGWLFHECIINAAVLPCEPESLGCGVLSRDNEDACSYWTSAKYGMLVTALNGFSPGDTVLAVGILDYSLGTWCIGIGFIDNPVFSACPDSLSPVVRTTWGTLKAIFR